MQLLPRGFSLPGASRFLLPGDSTGTGGKPGSLEPHPCLEAGGWEDPRLPEHLTRARGHVQTDQWGVRVHSQASTGVLVIVAVVKLEGLSGVVLRLWGGAWASSRNQLISWKRGGVRGWAEGSRGLAQGEVAGDG